MEVYTEIKYIGRQIVWRGVIKLFKPEPGRNPYTFAAFLFLLYVFSTISPQD